MGAWNHGAQLCVPRVRALSVPVGASVCEWVGVSVCVGPGSIHTCLSPVPTGVLGIQPDQVGREMRPCLQDMGPPFPSHCPSGLHLAQVWRQALAPTRSVGEPVSSLAAPHLQTLRAPFTAALQLHWGRLGQGRVCPSPSPSHSRVSRVLWMMGDTSAASSSPQHDWLDLSRQKEGQAGQNSHQWARACS